MSKCRECVNYYIDYYDTGNEYCNLNHLCLHMNDCPDYEEWKNKKEEG